MFRPAFAVASNNAVAVVVVVSLWQNHDYHISLGSNRVPVFHMPHITVNIFRATVCTALPPVSP